MKIDPFAVETVVLRVPLVAGEREVKELHFQPPTGKDLFAAGKYQEFTIPFYFEMMRSLTGEPLIILQKLIPEDLADCMVIAGRAHQRFAGQINLFDQKDEEADPTEADILSVNSLGISAA